jgi:Transposase DDE domain
MAQRKAKEESSGRTPGGSPPAEPQPGARPHDQVNLTDADSRIVPASGGGFEQAYNAQAVVDVGTMMIVAQHISQNPNDKQEVKPALDNLDVVAAVIGKAEALIADTGYFSADNVDACHEHQLEPYIAAWSRRTLPAPGRAAEPTIAGGRGRQCGRSHEASAAHPRRARGVRNPQVHRRANLRDHQIRARVPPFLFVVCRQCSMSGRWCVWAGTSSGCTGCK